MTILVLRIVIYCFRLLVILQKKEFVTCLLFPVRRTTSPPGTRLQQVWKRGRPPTNSKGRTSVALLVLEQQHQRRTDKNTKQKKPSKTMAVFTIQNDITALLDARYTFDRPWKPALMGNTTETPFLGMHASSPSIAIISAEENKPHETTTPAAPEDTEPPKKKNRKRSSESTKEKNLKRKKRNPAEDKQRSERTSNDTLDKAQNEKTGQDKAPTVAEEGYCLTCLSPFYFYFLVYFIMAALPLTCLHREGRAPGVIIMASFHLHFRHCHFIIIFFKIGK